MRSFRHAKVRSISWLRFFYVYVLALASNLFDSMFLTIDTQKRLITYSQKCKYL